MLFENYRCTVDNKQIPYNKSCIIALTLFAPPSRIHLYVLNRIRSPSLFRNESDRWYSSSHTSTWHRLCRNFLSCSVDLRNVVLKHFYSQLRNVPISKRLSEVKLLFSRPLIFLPSSVGQTYQVLFCAEKQLHNQLLLLNKTIFNSTEPESCCVKPYLSNLPCDRFMSISFCSYQSDALLLLRSFSRSDFLFRHHKVHT